MEPLPRSSNGKRRATDWVPRTVHTHAEERLSFCVCFSFILSNLERVHRHPFRFLLCASSLPHHFALFRLRIHIARPSNYVVYLLTHNFFCVCSVMTMSLLAILSVVAVCSRYAKPAIRRPFNHEIILLFILFLVHWISRSHSKR